MRGHNGRNTSPTYAFFHSFFEWADFASSFYQPTLNAWGRAHLDLASLRSRHAQALLDWSGEVMRPQPPLEMFACNVRLWQRLTEQAAEAAPGMMSAFIDAAETSAEVYQLPARRAHDRLLLLDRDEDAEGGPDDERRVA